MHKSEWMPSKSSVALSILTLVLGLAGGWYTASYFASEKMEARVAEAEVEAREKGLSDGAASAEREFQKTSDDRLIEMFPTVFDAIRKSSYNEGVSDGQEKAVQVETERIKKEGYEGGYQLGFSEGRKVGYSDGITEGRNRQLTSSEWLEAAQKNWLQYSKLIFQLANSASVLADKPGNSELESQLFSQALAASQVASDLQLANEEQAAAFNSLMTELRSAVEARNLPRIRELAIAISDTMESKGQRFIEAKKLEIETFSSLSN